MQRYISGLHADFINAYLRECSVDAVAVPAMLILNMIIHILGLH